MKVHELKCWPKEFDAVKQGVKDFEIRRDDRGFERGDIVVLHEFRPEAVTDEEDGVVAAAGYTGRSVGPFKIGYIERSSCLPEGWCGFRLRRMVVDMPLPNDQQRAADALEALASTVNHQRETIQVDDMSRER